MKLVDKGTHNYLETQAVITFLHRLDSSVFSAASWLIGHTFNG